MNNEKRNKHMTLDDRIEIQECLNKYTADKVLSRVGEGVYIMFDGFVLYADTDTALEGIALKKGLYFLRDEEGYISKLTVSYVSGELKKLDEKYLPDTAVLSEELTAASDHAVTRGGILMLCSPKSSNGIDRIVIVFKPSIKHMPRPGSCR